LRGLPFDRSDLAVDALANVGALTLSIVQKLSGFLYTFSLLRTTLPRV
jgi:hypothetical protein